MIFPVCALQLLLRSAPVDLVQQMLHKSILGDWDVICCMDASAINGVLEAHYKEQLKLYKEDPEAQTACDDDKNLYNSVIEINYTTPWIFERRDPVRLSIPVPAQLLCLASSSRA